MAMCRLAFDLVMRYSFDFDAGYPLLPLFGLGACFWMFVQLRPRNRFPAPVVYTGQMMTSSLFLILAMISAAAVLNLRGEPSLTPSWCVHFSTLTFFQLLLPYILSYGFSRTQPLVATGASLLLVLMLVKGTDVSRPAKLPVEQLDAGLRSQPAAPISAPASSGPRSGGKSSGWTLRNSSQT